MNKKTDALDHSVSFLLRYKRAILRSVLLSVVEIKFVENSVSLLKDESRNSGILNIFNGVFNKNSANTDCKSKNIAHPAVKLRILFGEDCKSHGLIFCDSDENPRCSVL